MRAFASRPVNAAFHVIDAMTTPLTDVKIIDPYVQKGLASGYEMTLASANDVDATESELRLTLPVGYREYVTTLGLGRYCNFIRIDMPATISSEYKEYQRFLDEYWFWDLGKDILPKDKAIESIKIGDTDHGDVIIFHPSNSSELFVLPRNDDMLHIIGASLYEALDWLCVSRNNPQSGSVGETHEKKYFVPHSPLSRTYGVLWPDYI